MPPDWARRKFGDFARRVKRINESGEELPPLSVTKDRGVMLQSDKFKKRIATDLRKYLVVHRGEFAFDPMSLYYGAVGRVRVVDRGVISPDYVAFEPDATVDHLFLDHLLRSPAMHDKYEAVAEGGNQFGKRRRVYWSVFADLEVALPPIEEQRKIAAILSSVDNTIEKVQASIGQLEVVKKGLLGELLTRGMPGRHKEYLNTVIGLLPAGWRVARLGDIVDFVNGRAFKPSDWKTEGLPIVRIQNLNGGTAFNYYSGEVESRFLLVPGDLLFSWSGTRGASFGPHIWRGPTGILNQHIFNVRNLRGASKLFLYYALKWVTAAVEQRAHGGTGIVHITKGQLESFCIPCPPSAEQEEIAEGLLSMDEAHAKDKVVLNEVRQLKASLLGALLSGRVRAPTLEQEAA